MSQQSRYASPADLTVYGGNASALDGISIDDQQSAIDAASTLADSYFRSRYGPQDFPLLSVGTDVKRAVCQIAYYDLLVVRGYNPAAAADINLRLRRDDAVAWLRAVGKQEAHADITTAVSGNVTDDAPRVISGTPQGWTNYDGSDR